jgi:outer membrane lipoprotein
MVDRKLFWLFVMVVLSVTVSGCSYIISPQLRKEVREDLSFDMVLKAPTDYKGSVVLWGGQVIETLQRPGGSEIIVLETPLGYLDRPSAAIYSRGRFIAKSTEFLDPAIYKEGMAVTLVGEMIGTESRPLGETSYMYPIVMVKEIHLWGGDEINSDSAPRYYEKYDNRNDYYDRWG